MPKVLKEGAIALLEGGIETYYLALYGMTIPSTRVRRKQETISNTTTTLVACVVLGAWTSSCCVGLLNSLFLVSNLRTSKTRSFYKCRKNTRTRC